MAYQNFTTYTEVDPGADITLTEFKTNWSSVADVNSYVYKDFGAAHFNGDFTWLFEFFFSSLPSGRGAGLALTNALGAWSTLYNAGADFQTFIVYNDGVSYELNILIIENGVEIWDATTFHPSLSTLYYVTFIRDDDGGANNTGRFTAEIRTGSHAGVLQETLTLDCSAGEQNDFRYVMPFQNDYWSGTAGDSSGYVQNLNIGEGRATKNTRAWPLGTAAGMALRMNR